MSAAQVAQGLALKSFMSLPAGIQRKLAGTPITVDGSTLAPDIQLLLKAMAAANVRQSGAVIDAVEQRKLSDSGAAMIGGRQPIGATRDLVVAGSVPARLYVPQGAPAIGPALMYIHGGGFVFGNLDSHDSTCRFLAEQAGVRVIAIDYRLAPEHPFPAASDDSVAAFEWIYDHARELGIDATRLAVGGDSAGGNLSAVVANTVKEKCKFQLLIYPVTDDHRHESGEKFGEGFFLTAEMMKWFFECYAPAGTDVKDPRFSPIYADIPDGVAPAYLTTAAFDPLRDEGEAYADKLRAAGVKVDVKRQPGLVHGFVNFIGVSRTAKAATLEVAAALKAGLS